MSEEDARSNHIPRPPIPLQVPELLAPAGDMETLRIAVKNGADAVYFGARSFNARAKAANFDDDQLTEAVDFLHEHSVRAYLTLNTLIADSEASQALHLAENAWRIGVDALILQDIGLLCAIRQVLPGLRLFASTQMSIGNEPGILAARDLGLSRVILPRELSAGEVRSLTAYATSIGMETEVFIHGALCVCYSGQCLMSAMQGGRSANRGACAQPCRLSYRMRSDRERGESESIPRLSIKDQSLYSHIGTLADMGVASFKIEGRLRSPAYVGTVTAVYRRVLDGQPEPGDEARLLQAFNRGGAFIDAFLTGRRGPDTRSGIRPGSYGVPLGSVAAIRPDAGILDIARSSGSRMQAPGASMPARGDVLAVRRGSEDIASAPAGIVETIAIGWRVKGFHPDALRLMQPGDSLFRMTDTAAERAAEAADRRKTGVKLHLEAIDGNRARLTASCRTLYGQPVSASAVHPADDVPPLPDSRVSAQLSKSGGTPFSVDSATVAHPAPMLGVASINAMRREALDSLRIALHEAYRHTRGPVAQPRDDAGFWDRFDTSDPVCFPIGKPEPAAITAFYWQWPLDGQPACGADIYLIPLRELQPDLGRERGAERIGAIKAAEPGSRVYAVLPPGLNGIALERATAQIDAWRAVGLDGVASRTVDIHTMFETFERSLEPGGNTYNAGSFRCHADKGLSRVAISHEAGQTETLAILDAAPSTACQAELWLYGRAGVMFSHTCPAGLNACANPDKGVCRGATHRLQDNRGREFPVVCHPGPCTVDILSSQPVNNTAMLSCLQSARRADGSSALDRVAWRLSFYDEPAVFRLELTRRLRTLLDPAKSVPIRSGLLDSLDEYIRANH